MIFHIRALCRFLIFDFRIEFGKFWNARGAYLEPPLRERQQRGGRGRGEVRHRQERDARQGRRKPRSQGTLSPTLF